jgi:hypothetical protein
LSRQWEDSRLVLRSAFFFMYFLTAAMAHAVLELNKAIDHAEGLLLQSSLCARFRTSSRSRIVGRRGPQWLIQICAESGPKGLIQLPAKLRKLRGDEVAWTWGSAAQVVVDEALITL